MSSTKGVFVKVHAVCCIVFLLSCAANARTNLGGDDYPIVIPFSFVGDHMVVEATINGQTGRYIFDSGTMLSWVRIDTAGLPVSSVSSTMIGGISQRVNVYSVDNIQFGDANVRAHSELISGSDFGQRQDGLLGMGVFEGFWVEMSFSENRILLHREKPSRFANASHEPLVMQNELSTLYLTIDINGREVLMGLDTGLQSAFFFPNDLPNYIAPGDMVGRVLSNWEMGDHYLFRVDSVTALDRTYNGRLGFNNSYVAPRRNWESHIDKGLIGVRFLRNYDLLFDYREILHGRTTRMYYIPIVPPNEREYGFSFITEVPEPGIINIFPSAKGFEVTGILEGSLAYTLGLRPGNEMTMIDGEPIFNFMEELRDHRFLRTITTITFLDGYGDEVTVNLR